MNGTVKDFRQTLSAQPTKKAKDGGRYLAPRVKGLLLERVAKLGGRELPTEDKEFWDFAPKANDFILKMVDAQVTVLEEEVMAEAKVAAEAKAPQGGRH